jgi:hypothetical protein
MAGTPDDARPARPSSPPPPPGGALGAGEPHRGQLVVHHIRADRPARAVHPLLDLVQELIDQHQPLGSLIRGHARIPQRHVVRHRFVITADQRGRGPQSAGQVKRFQNLHDLLAALHSLAFRLDT